MIINEATQSTSFSPHSNLPATETISHQAPPFNLTDKQYTRTSLSHFLSSFWRQYTDNHLPLVTRVWFFMEDINSVNEVNMVCRGKKKNEISLKWQCVSSLSSSFSSSCLFKREEEIESHCHSLVIFSFTTFTWWCLSLFLLLAFVRHDRNIELTTTCPSHGKQRKDFAHNTLKSFPRKTLRWTKRSPSEETMTLNCSGCPTSLFQTQRAASCSLKYWVQSLWLFEEKMANPVTCNWFRGEK